MGTINYICNPTEKSRIRLQFIAMLGRKEICDYRWKGCLYILSLFTIVWSYDPCPPHLKHLAQVPSIPEHNIESAFYYAHWTVQHQNQTRKSARVYPKGMKIPETVHPQARQKSEIYHMEAKQLIFDEASRFLAFSYDLSPTRVTCGLPQIHPLGPIAEKAFEDCVSKEEIVCHATSKFRTADGSCNNLDHPTWGRAFSPFQRMLLPSQTGPDGLRKSVGCDQLPNPRFLSMYLHHSNGKRTSKANNMFVSFGQFVTHDFAFTAQSTTEKHEAIQCCPPAPSNPPQCAPIDLNNYMYHENMTCINFVRSAPYPSCTLGHRTQINTATSFIDGSQIYGNSLEETKSLRALDGTGKLLVQNNRFGALLPASIDPENDRCSVPKNNQICFRAGDARVNQNPMLTSMHTIWVREHNRVATEMKRINPRWDEERLFQETRRIVIAEIHAIVIKEYLPLTLGDKYIESHLSGSNLMYMNTTNPNIYTEFSTAAFRFGHSMVDSTLAEMPRKPGHNGHLLRDKFSEPFGLQEEEVNLLMMGASRTPAQAPDRGLVTDLTNYLYRTRGQPVGLDLAALNIQRGRDHALPSYFEMYNLINPEQPIESFYDLEERHVMTEETIQALRAVYRDVRDIDLWPGIISEIPVHDGMLGPIGSTMVAAQFRFLIEGDRYWYSHMNQAGSFTQNQLSQFDWFTSLGKIICANTNITEMPVKAMQLPGPGNPIHPCLRNPGDHFYAWHE